MGNSFKRSPIKGRSDNNTTPQVIYNEKRVVCVDKRESYYHTRATRCAQVTVCEACKCTLEHINQSHAKVFVSLYRRVLTAASIIVLYVRDRRCIVRATIRDKCRALVGCEQQSCVNVSRAIFSSEHVVAFRRSTISRRACDK
jgi:hypothetical protein